MQIVHDGKIETQDGYFLTADLRNYCIKHEHTDLFVQAVNAIYFTEFHHALWDFSDRWNNFCKRWFNVDYNNQGRLEAEIDYLKTFRSIT